MYRAAQEALRNVLTHAQATRVSVRVSERGGVAVLDVVDDGVGFDPEQPPRRAHDGHFGLQGLRDLVADAGGTFSVTSAPGAGTTMHVEVPIT